MAAVTSQSFDYVYEVGEADLCNRALARIGADRIRDTAEDTKQARACRAVYAPTRDELLRMVPWTFAARQDLVAEDSAYPYELHGFSRAYKADDRFTLTGASGSAASAQLSGVDAAVVLDNRLVGRIVTGTNVRPGSAIVSVDAVARKVTLDRNPSGTVSAGSAICRIPLLKALSIANDIMQRSMAVGGGFLRWILADAVSESDATLGYQLALTYTRKVVDPSQFDAIFTDALVLRLASKIALSMTKDQSIVRKIEDEFTYTMRQAQAMSLEEVTVDEPDGWWTDRAVGSGPSTR